MSNRRDPLEQYAKPLAAVLIAVVISLILAAVIGGSLPFDYTGRATAYLVMLLYVIVGAFVVFKKVAAAEQSLAPKRLLKWTASLWVWPLLLLPRR